MLIFQETTRNYVPSKRLKNDFEGYYSILNAGTRKRLQISKNYIHDTLEDAKIKAEEMRLAEIEKLQSKITKLQELKF